MPELYEVIDELCRQKGVSGSRMCRDLGLSRNTMTELRKGRAKTITVEKAAKIADYFGVTVDYLLGKQAEPAPPQDTGLRMQLKSIAKIQGNKITPQEDKAISTFVDYLLAKREDEEE